MTPSLRIAAALVALVVLAGCSSGSGDDDASATTEATQASTTTEAAQTTTTTAAETTTTEVDDVDTPAENPAPNALIILGDTLGIVDSCAGRDGDGRLQYRYGLSNGGSLTVTFAGSQATRIVYEGTSGLFSGETDALGPTQQADGFVTGSGTLVGVGDGTETEMAYNATIPVLNCEDAATTTTTTSG